MLGLLQADVNQRVQNSLTGTHGPEQWALGAAVGHIAGYTNSGVTAEMVRHSLSGPGIVVWMHRVLS